jgi:hypothetical protein
MGAKAVVGKVDEFTGMLWRGWKNVQEQGAVQVGLRLPSYFPWVGVDGASLLYSGLFRSDYLLCAAGDDSLHRHL